MASRYKVRHKVSNPWSRMAGRSTAGTTCQILSVQVTLQVMVQVQVLGQGPGAIRPRYTQIWVQEQAQQVQECICFSGCLWTLVQGF